MNSGKKSLLITVLEYMGRGATPVDGMYWFDNPARTNARAMSGALIGRGIEPNRFSPPPSAASTAGPQCLGKCAVAPGS
jgi:hypothetical protein